MQHPNLRSLYKPGQTVWLVHRVDGFPTVVTGKIHSVTTTHVMLEGFTAKNMGALKRYFKEIDAEWISFYSPQGIYAQAAVLLLFTNEADAIERARNASMECLLVLKQKELDVVRHTVALTKQLMELTGGDARKGGVPEEVDQGIFNSLPEECEGCDGSGARPDTDNGSNYEGENKPTKDEHIVERCDYCKKFETDLDAAAALYNSVRTIESVDGFHAAVGSDPK